MLSLAEARWSCLKESILSLLGLSDKTRSGKLYRQGGKYLVGELAEEADENGYATVAVPFSWFSHIKYITVVTDLHLAKVIGGYGSTRSGWDNQVRLPYEITDIMMRVPTIVSRNDDQIISDRKNIKDVLGESLCPGTVVQDSFQQWCQHNLDGEIDLEVSCKRVMIEVLGRSLLGIEVFPDNIDEMISMLDKLDKAMTLFDKAGMKKYEQKIYPISEWIYRNNPGILSRGILPYLVDTSSPTDVNIACAFLVTPNITKLVYISVIFFAIYKEWQNTLRIHLEEDNLVELNNIYKELCRLYIPTNIPRFVSRDFTYNDVTFPAGTLFYILGRYIRMDPIHYPHPQEFNPDRYKDESIPMNSVKLCPFGIGPRQCPASSHFTKAFWLIVMKTVFTNYELSITHPDEIESFDMDARHLSLKCKYIARIKKLS